MRGRSVLRLRLSGEQTSGRLAVVAGVVLEGGPPLHVHEPEDEVVVVPEGRVDYQIGAERDASDAGGLLPFRDGCHALHRPRLGWPSQRDYSRALPAPV